MTPWVYRTGDYGKTWTRIVTPQQGVRGHAHVIKEDPVRPQLLFVGTEMGLWISLDGGKQWAEFKGGGFPAVAVRDLAFQQRDADLAIATHGRGIWVIDDLTPLRALTPDLLARDAAFLPGRQPQQRMAAQGGGPAGDASFTGENPASGAVITWYQRTRHLFGPIRLEVLDAQGKPVDTIPATKRRGLNRVSWTMRMPAPRVPRAAQLAFNASQGPRVPPGTYTIRLTKGAQVLETKLEVVVDRRAPYGVAERRANFEAGMRVHALFGDMSALVDRIDGARAAIEPRRAAPSPARSASASTPTCSTAPSSSGRGRPRSTSWTGSTCSAASCPRCGRSSTGWPAPRFAPSTMRSASGTWLPFPPPKPPWTSPRMAPPLCSAATLSG